MVSTVKDDTKKNNDKNLADFFNFSSGAERKELTMAEVEVQKVKSKKIANS